MPKSQQQLREDFNQNGFTFLMADLDSALAFAQRASRLNVDPEVRRRNVMNARKAYDTVGRLREKLQLDSEQQNAFDEKRTKLKYALEQLGSKSALSKPMLLERVRRLRSMGASRAPSPCQEFAARMV